ncbi:hypothetical protein Taro_031736 [Colocasia esculenta]|uniref:Uncharacterized protein n=1 Tax=Colocasia esculenta TaxID=4460 RepID=A0A843VXE4_COLES|nr:hypothetical protein [Colocasia esculenta]
MAMTGGASALVTLMERIAHKGSPARDPRGVRHAPVAVCLQVEVSLVMLCLSDGTVKLWFCVVFITYLYPSYGCLLYSY